ncbi:hypothetical protein WK95_00450 [Burkholderia ubonensis]|nr:hypothetical protein WK95_00450 [Burkholderia ubonensis]
MLPLVTRIWQLVSPAVQGIHRIEQPQSNLRRLRVDPCVPGNVADQFVVVGDFESQQLSPKRL